VIRYNLNSAVYNRAYINKRVLFNILSTILEQPSIDRILYILTHISLIYNPRVLVDMPNNILIALPPNPAIIELK
ncbi:hypothetical protein BGZ57DRAFT_776637, partial [Hyaloscypha finlandica]